MRAIKGSADQDPDKRAVKGSIRHCHFENTRIPAADWLFAGDYISAIDQGRPLPEVPEDIRSRLRDVHPDLGACA